jgi:hypothetical protein
VFQPLPTVVAFVAVLTAGLVPGLWTGRWGSSAALDAVPDRLAAVPTAVGPWSARDLDVTPRELQATEAAGILRRRYVNARTGSVVSLLIVAGRPGPVSLHTPDVCFPSAGFEPAGDAQQVDVSETGDKMKALRFQKTAPAPVYLRVLYGWSASGTWSVPDNARWTFARSPVLYKLYVVRDLTQADEPLDDDAAVGFLRELLPSLRTGLFPPG